MTTAPLIEIKDVTCYRGDTRVFTDLSLTVRQGESVAILGPNGAGKTTLLKLLTRDIYPVVKNDSYVKINGSELVRLDELRQHIGVVSQDLQERYTPYATGEQVVMSGLFGTIGMHPHLDVSDHHRTRVTELMAELGLAALADKMFQHLSSGQQRRLLLARAIINAPQSYVLDEPTNSLDLQAAFSLIRAMRTLARQGAGVIIATHHVSEVLPEIQRVVFIKAGRVVADGDKTTLFTSTNLSDLYDTPIHVSEQKGFYHVTPA